MNQSTRTCSVGGCRTPLGKSDARGLCATHYSRLRRTGRTGSAERSYVSRDGTCVVDGCAHPRYRRGMCRKHYVANAKRGDTRVACAYCGVDLTNTDRARKFCSRAHAAIFRRHGGLRESEKVCTRCGQAFSLAAGDASTRAKRSDVKMCDECKRARTTRHGWSAKAIVAVKGATDCGICGNPVDLRLRAPHLMRPSIDHIIPFSVGGSNELENLQLAHLLCNFRKSDRVGG